MKSFFEYLPLLVITALISSCGGGGGNSSSEPSSDSSPAASDRLEDTLRVPSGEDALLVVTQTKELEPDKDFLFRSSDPLNVRIDIKDAQKLPDRITICKRKDGDEVDFSECLYSGGMASEHFSRTFTVANDVESLAVVIWFYEPDVQQLVYVWERSLGNEFNVEL